MKRGWTANTAGDRFGGLVLVRRVESERGRGKYAVWLCRCDCGVEVVVDSHSFRRRRWCSALKHTKLAANV